MKPPISKLHADAAAVQTSTILNHNTSLGLLWQALIMLLLVAAMVVPGAAQGIYLAAQDHGLPTGTIQVYRFDGTLANGSLATTQLPLSMKMYQSTVLAADSFGIEQFDATNGNKLRIVTPDWASAIVVSGNQLFTSDMYGQLEEYDIPSGTMINSTPIAANLDTVWLAAHHALGGLVHLYVSNNNTGSASGSSIQEVTVNPSTGRNLGQRTLVSGMLFTGPIAVSEDETYLYALTANPSCCEIDEFKASDGTLSRVLVANVGCQFCDMALSGSNLFVTNSAENYVGRLDLTKPSLPIWNATFIPASLVRSIAVTPGDGDRIGDGTMFCTPPPAGLVAWYPFDSTQFYDLAKRNDASLVSISPVQLEQGEASNALVFDASFNDYLAAIDRPWLNMDTGDLSFDAWVKISNPQDNNGVASLIDKRSWDGGNVYKGYHFFLYQQNPTDTSLFIGLQLADGTGNSTYTNYLSSSSFKVPADNLWHLVAVTVSRPSHAAVTFYLDGVQDPQIYAPRLGNLDNGALLVIGARQPYIGGGFFKGGLDELEIFNSALSASDVGAIYHAGTAGKCK